MGARARGAPSRGPVALHRAGGLVPGKMDRAPRAAPPGRGCRSGSAPSAIGPSDGRSVVQPPRDLGRVSGRVSRSPRRRCGACPRRDPSLPGRLPRDDTRPAGVDARRRCRTAWVPAGADARRPVVGKAGRSRAMAGGPGDRSGSGRAGGAGPSATRADPGQRWAGHARRGVSRRPGATERALGPHGDGACLRDRYTAGVLGALRGVHRGWRLRRSAVVDRAGLAVGAGAGPARAARHRAGSWGRRRRAAGADASSAGHPGCRASVAARGRGVVPLGGSAVADRGRVGTGAATPPRSVAGSGGMSGSGCWMGPGPTPVGRVPVWRASRSRPPRKAGGCCVARRPGPCRARRT